MVDNASRGHGLNRLQTFLLSSLKPSTVEKYTLALQSLNSELEEQQLAWENMSEENQDFFLAELLLDSFDSGGSRAESGWLLSAVQKVYPRLRLKVAWKVFDTWGALQPPRQAPAAPPELVQAMIAASLLLNRPHISAMILLCYCGLLRVREALGLTGKDVVVQADGIVLCLGQTKRGLEQKVILKNRSVLCYMIEYFRHVGRPKSDELVLPISYGTALRWVKRIAELLGAGSLQLTTHSLRRSGASELSKRGMPLADILLYGRWLSERSAREYIRRGEVAVVRARTMLAGMSWERIDRWSKLCDHCWVLYAQLFSRKNAAIVNLDRVTTALFQSYEGHVFSLVRT